MTIIEQAEWLPVLRATIEYLKTNFVEACECGFISGRGAYDALSDIVESNMCVGYQEAKIIINDMWGLFKKDLIPIFSLVDPGVVPVETKDTFIEAQRLSTSRANLERFLKEF